MSHIFAQGEAKNVMRRDLSGIVGLGKRRSMKLGDYAVENINNVTWFLMDAVWMLGFHWASVGLAPPVLISGFALVVMEKRKDVRLVNLAMFFWIVMNVSWCLSEALSSEAMLTLSRAAFSVGVVILLIAARVSGDFRELLASYRRPRWQGSIQ